MPAFAITIAGSEASFSCHDDDTLLRAGLRAGLGISYDCNVGACGSCKITIVEGEFEVLRPDAPGLSARDVRKGRQLACQCRPKSDCTLNIRLHDALAPPIVPKMLTAELVAKRPITHDMIAFEFATREPAEFLPGQYALISVPGVPSPRPYSMSNLANGEGRWSFAIRRVPDGQATAFLFDELTLGQRIALDGPYGNAYLRPPSDRDIVCIAGGSGLAPMMSIAKGAAMDAAWKGRTHFFYGARTGEDLLPAGLFDDAISAHDRFHLNMAVSEADTGNGTYKADFEGLVHEMADQFMCDAPSGAGWDNSEIYLAGPPPMIDAAVQLIALERKADISRIRYDRFF